MNENEAIVKAICFCADKNYLQYVVPAIESIRKAEPAENFEFHIISDVDLSDTIKEKFLNVIKDSENLVWHKVDEDKFLGMKEVAHFTRAMYYRLLIPELIPYKKVLYLDCDILVRKPLSDIFNTEMCENYIAAVINPFFDRPEIVYPGDYFNSGVMLFNCNLWKRDSIADKVIEVIKTKCDLIRMPDQDALNIVISGRWERLSWAYNSQMSVYLNGAKKSFFPKEAVDPIIVHFSAGNKQWFKSCGLIFAKEYLQLNTAVEGLKVSVWRDLLVVCYFRLRSYLTGKQRFFFFRI